MLSYTEPKLPSNSKKAIQISLFLGIFCCLGFSSTLSAASLSSWISGVADTLGLVNAQSKDKDNNNDGNERTNIQNLKVFEADKNLKAVAQNNQNSIATIKNVNDNDDLSLDAGEENFYAGESVENVDEDNFHSDNVIYKVQKGESIYSIASYFSISAETILSYNKIDEKEIKVGMILEVPSTPGILYSITKGDTLNKLAEKYKIDVNDITLYNGLLENESLAVGEEIFLPGAKEEKKEVEKTKTKAKSINKSQTATKASIASLGNLSKYIKYLGKGSTAQNNKIADVKKYASLPKFPGYYIYPAPGTSRTQTLHGKNGSDFAGKIGTTVVASAGGTVKVAKSSGYNFGFGNYIIVGHPNGTETIYAHLSAVNVSVGQNVSQGQKIGALGSSGNSTGPHLHFEIRGGYNPWAW